MSTVKSYQKIKWLAISSVFIFCSTVIYLELPYYLQKHYDTNIIESPYPYKWYSETNFSNDKTFFIEIKNNKSIHLSEALDFNMVNFNKYKDGTGVYYYKNIYDNSLTNIIVSNKESYKKIKFEVYDKPIEDLIFNNYNSHYLDKQTFYIRENYNFKSWIYSDNDSRHNIINYSDNQIDLFYDLLSPTLKSFNDEDKRNLIISYTLAHEMAHTQDYQILTDITLKEKEVLADLSSAVYLLKLNSFDKLKGNEIINMIERFRSIPLNQKSSTAVYLPFDGLEYLRYLLNSKNPILLNIQNSQINYLVINIDKKKIAVGSQIVKKLLNVNATYSNMNIGNISSLLSDYTALRLDVTTANKVLSKGERDLTLSLAQTYKTNASRVDIVAQVKLDKNLERSYNAYLASRQFELDNGWLFILMDSLKIQDNIDYRKNLSRGNEQYVDVLSKKITMSLSDGISLTLSNYIRLAGLLDHNYALNYVNNLQFNTLISKNEKFTLIFN